MPTMLFNGFLYVHKVFAFVQKVLCMFKKNGWVRSVCVLYSDGCLVFRQNDLCFAFFPKKIMLCFS